MLNKDFIFWKIKLIQENLAELEVFGNFVILEPVKNKLEQNATERVLEKIITRAIDINKHIITNLGEGKESVKTNEETFLVLAKLKVYDEKFAK